MFNIGGGELIIVLLVALVVLGPDRLPGAAKEIGKAMSELRSMSQGFTNELKSAMDDTLEDAAYQRGAEHVAPQPADDQPQPADDQPQSAGDQPQPAGDQEPSATATDPPDPQADADPTTE